MEVLCMRLHLTALIRLATLLLLHDHILHLKWAFWRHWLIPRLKVAQSLVRWWSQSHKPIQAFFTDDCDETAEPFLLCPLGLVIVELCVTLYFLDALHEFHVTLEQFNIFLLFLVVVERVVFLHGILGQMRLVIRSGYRKMLAPLYFNESIQ